MSLKEAVFILKMRSFFDARVDNFHSWEQTTIKILCPGDARETGCAFKGGTDFCNVAEVVSKTQVRLKGQAPRGLKAERTRQYVSI